MTVQAVETIELSDFDVEEAGWVEELSDDYRKVLFVRVHTDDGEVGLGETYPRPAVDAEVVHRYIAPEILGTDPHEIERLWRDVHRRANFYTGYGGAEMRALSAVDVALWELKGKRAGLPV